MSIGFTRQANHRPSFAERHVIHRLLLPVKNQDEATESIAYAIRRRAEGAHVQVVLLHVNELNETWSLWGHVQPAHAGKRHGAADVFCQSLRMLEGLDIELSTYVRTGPIVFSILDAAEQLDCSEVVVPAPGKLHLPFLSRNVVMTLLAWQRSVPVITVNKNGIRQPTIPLIAAAEASAH